MANIGQRIIDEPMILTEHISQWEIMVLHLCLKKNPFTQRHKYHGRTTYQSTTDLCDVVV
jgi:hypothetical protein